MPTEMPERCERRVCMKKGVTWVSYAIRPDGSLGMWLCRKHEMQEARALRDRKIKDKYDKD